MGRPALDIGTAGVVRVYPAPTGGYSAETLFRDLDGKVRRVERHAATRSAADRALQLAVRDRTQPAAGRELTPDSKVKVLARIYLDDIALSDRSPSTVAQYQDRIEKQILPALGEIRVRELSVGRVDIFLKGIRRSHGPSLAKMTRSVLSGMCALAARRDVMKSNPVRDTAPIRTKPQRPAQPLDDDQLRQFRKSLLESELAHELDVVDLVQFMIATGCRLGEALALPWSNIDLPKAAVKIQATAIRVKGQGVLIKDSPKKASSVRVLELPTWCVEMLVRRPRTNLLVFPAPRSGSVRDPSNTIKAIHRAVGYKIKSHSYRKTPATLMDDAGLPARKASDQLGHSRTSQTQDAYFGRKRLATGAASVLEGIFQD